MVDLGKTSVLVADDEPSTRAMVARHLRSIGYKVVEAVDGDEAFSLALEHLPDLVVLDVMMPGMSGWEVCRRIRETVSLAHTGVIMLTGIGESLNEMTSPLYGADAYLDKPFEFAVLDRTLSETLQGRHDHVGRPDGADVEIVQTTREDEEGIDAPPGKPKRARRRAGSKADEANAHRKAAGMRTRSREDDEGVDELDAIDGLDDFEAPSAPMNDFDDLDEPPKPSKKKASKARAAVAKSKARSTDADRQDFAAEVKKAPRAKRNAAAAADSPDMHDGEPWVTSAAEAQGRIVESSKQGTTARSKKKVAAAPVAKGTKASKKKAPAKKAAAKKPSAKKAPAKSSTPKTAKTRSKSKAAKKPQAAAKKAIGKTASKAKSKAKAKPTGAKPKRTKAAPKKVAAKKATPKKAPAKKAKVAKKPVKGKSRKKK